MSATPLTKPGPYGTLYRYRFWYDEDMTWDTWAYTREHAVDKWHESNWGGWVASHVARLYGRPTDGVRHGPRIPLGVRCDQY